MILHYFADQICDIKSGGFLNFPHWWQYLGTKPDALGNCAPDFRGLSSKEGGLHDIFAVGLAVLDIMLYLAGIITVAYIIIAGIQYILSSGNPEKTAAVLTRIVNAAIGLGIVITAAAAVAFIGNSFK